jgi:hypothetical protein
LRVMSCHVGIHYVSRRHRGAANLSPQEARGTRQSGSTPSAGFIPPRAFRLGRTTGDRTRAPTVGRVRDMV